MGYISIASSDIGDFDKAVMSLWFKIPQATIDAMRAVADGVFPHDDEPFNDGFCGIRFADPPLFGIIPLVTFGSLEETLSGADPGGNEPVSPSFIGIDFSHEDTPHVAVNLQTAVAASFNKSPTHPEDEYRPACFYMRGYSHVDPQALPVVGDQWHQIMFSFDISSSCSLEVDDFDAESRPVPEVFTFGPTFSWAFDDESKVGPSMAPSGHQDSFGGNPNHIVPQLITLFRFSDFQDTGPDPEDVVSPIEITYSGMEIKQSGNPMGVPASSGFVTNVHNVIMAELQIFTGVTLDCSVEANRRAFRTSDGNPASPSLAAALLGKDPEVYFRTHGNWSAGNNQGTTADLTPTGTISAYTPGP